jgi:hypothetical protein
MRGARSVSQPPTSSIVRSPHDSQRRNFVPSRTGGSSPIWYQNEGYNLSALHTSRANSLTSTARSGRRIPTLPPDPIVIPPCGRKTVADLAMISINGRVESLIHE